MIKQKKILFLFIVIVSFISLLFSIKLIDIFLQKKFGLGTPVIYETSRTVKRIGSRKIKARKTRILNRHTALGR